MYPLLLSDFAHEPACQPGISASQLFHIWLSSFSWSWSVFVFRCSEKFLERQVVVSTLHAVVVHMSVLLERHVDGFFWIDHDAHVGRILCFVKSHDAIHNGV